MWRQSVSGGQTGRHFAGVQEAELHLGIETEQEADDSHVRAQSALEIESLLCMT
jgi:hypothetical protein